MILTHFDDLHKWTQLIFDTIGKCKKPNVSYKQTIQWLHDVNVTTIKFLAALLVFI